jgi:drug/metabolite transporter (DMT)-like permease
VQCCFSKKNDLKMKREGTKYGVMLMLLSVVAFAIMASLVKTVSEVSTYVTVFMRFAVGVGILSILALFRKIDLKFFNSPLLLLRGISGTASVALFYLAIVKIGVGKGSVYSYSYPVFASLLSVFMLKERVSFMNWVMIITAFVGILLLSWHPGAEGGVSFNWYEMLAILSALTNAISIILVKKLHNTDSSTSIFFSQSIVGFWIFLIPANLPTLTGPITASYILIIIGLVSAAAQLLNTEAYRHISVSAGSPLHMLIPVLNVLIGVFLFGEVLSMIEYAGAFLVVLSCVGIMVVNAIQRGFVPFKLLH